MISRKVCSWKRKVQKDGDWSLCRQAVCLVQSRLLAQWHSSEFFVVVVFGLTQIIHFPRVLIIYSL